MKLSTIFISLLIFVAGLSAVAAQRAYTPVVMDSSVIPTRESALTKISFDGDSEQVVNLSSLPFVPLILQVRADGDFHEGTAEPVQDNDLWRDGNQVWSIPVNGATSWHFKRRNVFSATTLFIKVLGSN